MKKLLSMLLAFTLAFSNVSAVNIVSANDSTTSSEYSWEDLWGWVGDNVIPEDTDFDNTLGDLNLGDLELPEDLTDFDFGTSLPNLDLEGLLGELDLSGLTSENLEEYANEILEGVITQLEGAFGEEFEFTEEQLAALEGYLTDAYDDITQYLETYIFIEGLTDIVDGILGDIADESGKIESIVTGIVGNVQDKVENGDFDNLDQDSLVEELTDIVTSATKDILKEYPDAFDEFTEEDISGLVGALVGAVADAVDEVETFLDENSSALDDLLGELEDALGDLLPDSEEPETEEPEVPETEEPEVPETEEPEVPETEEPEVPETEEPEVDETKEPEVGDQGTINDTDCVVIAVKDDATNGTIVVWSETSDKTDYSSFFTNIISSVEGKITTPNADGTINVILLPLDITEKVSIIAENEDTKTIKVTMDDSTLNAFVIQDGTITDLSVKNEFEVAGTDELQLFATALYSEITDYGYTVATVTPEEVPTPSIYFGDKDTAGAVEIVVGDTLTVKNNDGSTIENAENYTIQWFRAKSNVATRTAMENTFNYTAIDGANAVDYQLTTDDIGYQIAVGLAENTVSSDDATDYKISPLTQSFLKEVLTLSTIAHDFDNKTITATYKNGTLLTDSDGFTYKWALKNASDTFEDVSGATGATYNYGTTVGTYQVTVTPDDNADYTDDSATAEITVSALEPLQKPIIRDTNGDEATTADAGDTLKVLESDFDELDSGEFANLIFEWYVGSNTTPTIGTTFEVPTDKSKETIYVVATPNNALDTKYEKSLASDSVTINEVVVNEYLIKFNESNATITSTDAGYTGELEADKVYNFSVTAATDYTLPDSIVNPTGATITDYTLNADKTTATFTLTAGSSINADVTITVTAIPKATEGAFGITFKGLTNITLKDANEDDRFNAGSEYSFTLVPNAGYTLPDLTGIVSDDGGDLQRKDTTNDDGSVTITITNVKGDLAVKAIEAIKSDYEITLTVAGTGIKSSTDDITLAIGEDLVVELELLTNYQLPLISTSIVMDGKALVLGNDFNLTNKTITIPSSKITGDCTIVITTEATIINKDLYTIDFEIDGAGIKIPSTTTVNKDDDLTVTLEILEGYLADTFELTGVSFEGTALKTTDYTFDEEKLELVINSNILTSSGTITITASADKDVSFDETYQVSIDIYGTDDVLSTDTKYVVISDRTDGSNMSVNGKYSFKLAASAGYQLPENISVSEMTSYIDTGDDHVSFTYDLSDDRKTADVEITNITSKLLVVVQAEVESTIYYDVVINTENSIIKTTDPAKTVAHGDNYVITFEADEGYYFTTSSVTVDIGGRNWEAFSEFAISNSNDFDVSTGELTVYGVEGDLTINVTATKIPTEHTLWFSLWGLYSDAVKSENGNKVTVGAGEDYTVTLKLKSGYSDNYEIPSEITKITNDRTGEVLEEGEDYVYSSSSSIGTLKIFDITDSFSVYASATLKEDADSDDYEDDDEDEDDTTTSSTYKITFVDASGNTITTLTTGTNKTLSTLPSITTTDNIIFLGWYLSGGTKVTTSTVFSDNRTVYAKTATVLKPTYGSDGNHYISTSNTDIAISAESLTGGTITVNSNGKVDNFIIIPPTSGYATTTQTNIVLPDSNGNTVTWTVPAGSVIDDNNYLNLAVTVSESPIHSNSTIGRSLGYIDFAHDGNLLANYKSLTVTFRLYNVTTGDTIQINKLDDYNDITGVYVDGSAIGNSYIRANFYSCSRWEIFAKNYTYQPDGNGGGSYTQFFNIPTTGYITELRNVQLNQVIDLTKINVGNGLVIEGWYYDQAFTNKVSNPSYVVVSEAIIKTGLYPKYVSDYVTPETGNPYPDAGNGYLPDLSDNPSTSTTTLATLF